jgi:hypothetical protein
MGQPAKIYQVIGRARRRLRLQAALEGATTAAILAVAAAVAALYLWRRGVLGGPAAAGVASGAGLLMGLGALWRAGRGFSTELVAARVDRASGLADRLGTACDFERRLREGHEPHPETRALMQAAIDDAVRHLPQADPVAAAPLTLPRDARALAAFTAVGAVVSLLSFPAPDRPCAGQQPCTETEAQSPAADRHRPPPDPVQLDEDEHLYSQDLLDELAQTAEQTQDEHLKAFVKDMNELLEQARKGELSKEQLLRELAARERKYMEGADDNLEQTLGDLKQTGQELKKSPATRELGQALAQGDLQKAQQEFDKLAQKVAQNQLSAAERKELAKALERAGKAFERQEQQRDDRQEQKIAEAKRELRQLQRKMDQERNPDRKREQARRFERKQRELKRLEKAKQQREESAQRRTLKRLHRNLRNTAEDLQKDQSSPRHQRQVSRRMQDLARDTGRVDADRRKINNQRKVASQVTDLKEALRRARRKKTGGRDRFGKNQRNRDFRQRASGQPGQRSAWRPGQSGQSPGQKGESRWGNEDGGDPLGAPTPRTGQTKDESLTGEHGRGPSTRETIVAAAQKGFATRNYKQVYANYKTIIEEVMRTEKVPSGYKYYIKRYFQKIKPHSMD